MAEKGWISIHRQIQDCWIWNDEPYSKGQAWVDLLLNANHEDKKKRIGNQLVTIHSGQFHTSILSLAKRWQWSEKKVRRFLELLKSDKMVLIEGSTHGTTLTIVNYEFFQGGGRAVDPIVDRTSAERSTERLPTNNNVNNDNNINNKKDNNRTFTPPKVEEVRAYCQERGNSVDPETFVAFYESKGWMIGKNKMKSWKSAIITWEKSGRNNKKTDKPDKAKQGFNSFEQRKYDFNELTKIVEQ